MKLEKLNIQRNRSKIEKCLTLCMKENLRDFKGGSKGWSTGFFALQIDAPCSIPGTIWSTKHLENSNPPSPATTATGRVSEQCWVWIQNNSNQKGFKELDTCQTPVTKPREEIWKQVMMLASAIQLHWQGKQQQDLSDNQKKGFSMKRKWALNRKDIYSFIFHPSDKDSHLRHIKHSQSKQEKQPPHQKWGLEHINHDSGDQK